MALGSELDEWHYLPYPALVFLNHAELSFLIGCDSVVTSESALNLESKQENKALCVGHIQFLCKKP